MAPADLFVPKYHPPQLGAKQPPASQENLDEQKDDESVEQEETGKREQPAEQEQQEHAQQTSRGPLQKLKNYVTERQPTVISARTRSGRTALSEILRQSGVKQHTDGWKV